MLALPPDYYHNTGTAFSVVIGLQWSKVVTSAVTKNVFMVKTGQDTFSWLKWNFNYLYLCIMVEIFIDLMYIGDLGVDIFCSNPKAPVV